MLWLLVAVCMAALLGSWAGTTLGTWQHGPALQHELVTLRSSVADLHEHDAELVQRTVVQMRPHGAAAALPDRLPLQHIEDQYGAGICLMHGRWGLRLPSEVGVEESAGWLVGPDGDRLEMEYTGSGFYVGRDQIVTNRHIVRPWEQQPFATVVGHDFEPVFFSLTATFPGHDPIPVDVSDARVHPAGVDVAVVPADVPADTPVLPLDPLDAEFRRGESVLLAGYPTGVAALLAKAAPPVAEDYVGLGQEKLTSVIQRLAHDRAVSPVMTTGVLTDVLDEKLVYDAATAEGGSGGPVFASDGTVIGVNFALVTGFGGANLGVPIRYVRALLR